jgi:hypothetical protein
MAGFDYTANVDYKQDIGGALKYPSSGGTQLGGGSFGSSAAPSSSGGGASTGLAVTSKVTGALLNAWSAYSSQKNVEVTSKYNRAVLAASERVKQIGFNLEQDRITKAGKSLLSRQVSVISKSGLEMSGAPIEVIKQSAEDVEYDIQMVKLNALSSQYETQNELKLLEIQQKSARRNKWAAAIGAFGGSLS